MLLIPKKLMIPAALLVSASFAAAGDLPKVENGAKPSGGSVTLDLTDPWERGDDSDDIIFGRIMQVLRDGDGNSYVLDQQLGEIQVFDAGGEWLYSIGRSGEGPGEFNPDNVADLFFTPDNKIAVAVRFPGRVIQWSTDGTAESDFPLPTDEGFFSVGSGERAGEHVVLGGTAMAPSDNGMSRKAYIRLFDDSGAQLAEMFSADYAFDFAALLFKEKELYDATNAYAVDGSGRVLIANTWDDYAITVHGADGTPMHVITRVYEKGKRTDEELERAKNRYGIVINGREATVEIEEANRAVREIIPRPDGGFWVRSGREASNLPDGVLVRLDEFDSEGKYTREILLKAPGNPMDDGVFVRGDAVYVVPGMRTPSPDDEDEEAAVEPEALRLLCYALPDGALASQ